MSLFDTRTIFLLCGFMGGLMALVLYSLKRNYPPSIKGPGEWSAALMLLFVAGVVTALRGRIPDLIAISASNLLFFFGLYWSYVGTQRFFGQTPRYAPWFAVLAVVTLAHFWLTFVQEMLLARLILVNLMGAVFMGAQALLIRRYPPMTVAKGMAMGSLLAASALQLFRVWLATTQNLDNNILGPSVQHQIYAAGFALSILLYSIGLILMATEMLRAELEMLATRDSLTNALTRRHWNTLFESELERSKRSGRSIGILALDLDHFKAINDTHGHQAGDKVLVDFVAHINRYLRQNDRLGRFGGEEFILLLPETSLEQAQNVAERIRAGVDVSNGNPGCTVSIGVTATRNGNETMDAVLARADAAMYRAKEGGRNRVETG
jgi:diguanylate cyclase (GGDEF)-like protein